MTISTLPTAPVITDIPADFNTKAFALVAALATFVSQANTDIAQANTDAGTATTGANTATAKALLTANDALATAADRLQTNADVLAAAASAAAAAAIAGAFVGTSTTSWTPTVESKVFTTQTGEQYTPGIFVTIVSAGTPSAFGFGQVTSYSGSTLAINVQFASGSGTHTDWNISLAGARGADGANGPGNVVATPVKTSTYTALAADLVRVNSTAGAFTVSLSATPTDGDKVGIFDIVNMCGTNPVLLAVAGGKTIEGDATGISVNINGACFVVIYNSSTNNWKIADSPGITTGDVFSGLSTSVDSEMVLFSGTAGKTIKRSALTGIIKSTSGVASAATAGTDYVTPTGSDGQLTRQMLIDCGHTVLDKGSVSSGTATFDYTAGSVQTWTNGGAHTVAMSNWPPAGNLGEILLVGTNLGSATITWPTITWLLPDGTTTTSVATYLAANTGRTTLQTSGVDQILLWSRDAGTTVYGKLL